MSENRKPLECWIKPQLNRKDPSVFMFYNDPESPGFIHMREVIDGPDETEVKKMAHDYRIKDYPFKSDWENSTRYDQWMLYEVGDVVADAFEAGARWAINAIKNSPTA